MGRHREPRDGAGVGLDTNLAVGGWGLTNGRCDPLCGSNGGPFWGPLMIRWGVLLCLSAVATEALSQATDAQEGYDDQKDDDKDPGVRNHQRQPGSPAMPAAPPSLP